MKKHFSKDLIKELYEDQPKRLFYKREFIKRNEEIQRLKMEIQRNIIASLNNKASSEERNRAQHKIVELRNQWPSDSILSWTSMIEASLNEMATQAKNKLKDIHSELKSPVGDREWSTEEFIAFETLSPIEITFNGEGKIYGSKPLSHDEIFLPQYLKRVFNKSLNDWIKERGDDEIKGLMGDSIALDAVNKEERTITIKIHLNRKKEDIKRDVEFLLDLLESEAEQLEVDLGITKRPQWDVYDKYLQVYDLKKADPKMEWSEIAKIVFPEEIYKNPIKKPKKKKIVPKSTEDKVRYYWREADKMVNKGGWRQI